MTIRQKLEIIQKLLGLTQTKLAQKFGVSFAAFNSWWTGKSTPRPKMQAAIDELFLEVTGQKIIPDDELTAKKQILRQKSSKHKSVINQILSNPDICGQFVPRLAGSQRPLSDISMRCAFSARSRVPKPIEGVLSVLAVGTIQ